jgi:hypothetical protein
LSRYLVDLRRLLPLVCGTVDFPVPNRLWANEMRQNQRRDKRGLPVLARNAQDRPANQPPPVNMRLINVPDKVLLPVPELERPALPDTARNRKPLNKVNYPLRPPWIAINPSNLLFCCLALGSFRAARDFGSRPSRSPMLAIA